MTSGPETVARLAPSRVSLRLSSTITRQYIPTIANQGYAPPENFAMLQVGVKVKRRQLILRQTAWLLDPC